MMASRGDVERILLEIYDARVGARLDDLCTLFAPDASFRITGASEGKPIAIKARGMGEIRPWLGMLVKTFRMTSHAVASMVIEGDRAAVHWSADIHSKITGVTAPTELVDLIEVRSGRISSYLEFFVPCRHTREQ